MSNQAVGISDFKMYNIDSTKQNRKESEMKDTKFELLDIIGRMNEKGIAVLYMIARKLILLKKYRQ